MTTNRIDAFRALHREGCFLMPNPHDVGSAKLLESIGFPALATTSSGFAATMGHLDMTLDRDTVLAHVAEVTAAVDLPVNVDSERCFAEELEGIKETVELIARAGAAGCSIEDWNPAAGEIDPLEQAVLRVRAAADAAAESGVVLTARCENLLRGIEDLDGTIERLLAYREAGAEVLYAPGLRVLDDIRRVVSAAEAPVNVLLWPGGPSVGELAEAGVRRISTGGLLAGAAYGVVVETARFLLSEGTVDPSIRLLDRGVAAKAFG